MTATANLTTAIGTFTGLFVGLWLGLTWEFAYLTNNFIQATVISWFLGLTFGACLTWVFFAGVAWDKEVKP